MAGVEFIEARWLLDQVNIDLIKIIKVKFIETAGR